MIIVSLFIYKFTNNYCDKRTWNNISELEKKTTKINTNILNTLLTTTLLKVQVNINELILFYKKLANQTDQIISNETNDFLKNPDEIVCQNISNLTYKSLWFINSSTTLTSNLSDIAKKQLKAYSNTIQNVHATFEATKNTIEMIYLFFEKTDLFISFPLSYFCFNNYMDIFREYKNNPKWCRNSNGTVFREYYFKCRDVYQNVKKAQAGLFDNNKSNFKDRTIYATNSYKQLGFEDNYTKIFTFGIQFDDPISGGLAYYMADVHLDDLALSFDNFNSKLSGYFLITSVGFNNVFYFPQMSHSIATPSEYIFSSNKSFYLEEKIYFMNNIQKIIISNYNQNINDNNNSIFNEIKVNGVNTSDQYFYFNEERFNYSIYPIVLDNIKGEKEHILSIIHIYNDQLYYNYFKSDQSKTILNILLEVIIYVIFGSGLLYIVVLSFNSLSKYIVIPIKNVNYMLKGIHIGGENRLSYLESLKNRQDNILAKLEKIYDNTTEKKYLINYNNETDNKHLLREEDNEDDNKNCIKNGEEIPLIKYKSKRDIKLENKMLNDIEFNGEIINQKKDYNKIFDKENEYIEKEINFYDFDEELLQYRPLEIDHLVKVLLDLKGALLLTSNDHQVEEIINYSHSEEIFRNFKNKEGATICQSNIGNLQSQLLKFDKAIYHLALSLEDDKLKRFLSKTLSDEYDESDTLLNKISLSYCRDKNKETINILAEKQQNSSRDTYSKKIIGILINSRYCKLINVYFKFFTLIQKSKIEMLSGQFMNTHLHNINYFHKTIIQYIYLSYVKNDLIKIGESILDYIEFLIKFKLKTTSDSKYFMNIHNKNKLECKDKQKYKKKIFNKIISWFNLFHNYVSYVKDNSSLGDDKNLADDYTRSLNSANGELNSSTKSGFLFRVNIQRGDFLKGKFALACKNYIDALFFFIRAAKKKSIVLDGLIQKKALKHIYKLSKKLSKNLEKYGMINVSYNQKMIEYEKIKKTPLNKRNSFLDKSFSNFNDIKNEDKNDISFGGELNNIKNEILKDINESNIKQAKDIIILIDFNLYDPETNNNSNNVDAFVDQTKTILNNYLSNNDRLGVFIYKKQYKIVCPLICKNEIDINNFCKDLNNYRNKYNNELDDIEEYEDLNENDLIKEKIELSNNEDSSSRSEESYDVNYNKLDILQKLSGLLQSINYTKTYLTMKEADKNEKYIILFTYLFNYFSISEEEILDAFEKLSRDREINFLLVGKFRRRDLKNENEMPSDEDNEKGLHDIINEKFGGKSELIDFDNIKKIQTILASNNVIKDEIIYPNEIYM